MSSFLICHICGICQLKSEPEQACLLVRQSGLGEYLRFYGNRKFCRDEGGTVVESEKTVVQYQDVALVDPESLFHLRSACNVLR
jgi:hypothetical protein